MYGISGISNMTASVWKSEGQAQQTGWSPTTTAGSSGSSATEGFQNVLSNTAGQGAAAVQQGPSLDQRTSALINRLDKDGDGALSSDEMGISADAFSKIDANSDGKLDMHELNAAYLSAHASQQYGNALNGSASTSSSTTGMSTSSA